MTHSWGSKFVAMVFSFIIHTENYHFVGIGIRGLHPPRKQRKFVPTKFKPSAVISLLYVHVPLLGKGIVEKLHRQGLNSRNCILRLIDFFATLVL